jgi:hypothetical protein
MQKHYLCNIVVAPEKKVTIYLIDFDEIFVIV